MRQILKKTIIGFVVGSLLVAILGNNQTLPVECILICFLWSVGSTYAFSHHVDTLLKMLNPGLKLSVISFLSFGNGFMGSVPILVYLLYCIVLGWLHGLVLLMVEVYRVIT